MSSQKVKKVFSPFIGQFFDFKFELVAYDEDFFKIVLPDFFKTVLAISIFFNIRALLQLAISIFFLFLKKKIHI